MRILVVEDERDIASMIGERMSRSGYVADRVGSLCDALEALRAYDYPAMLLDRRLPDGDGLSILPDIRRERPGIRVLMITAMRSIDDRIDGLDAGADDYLTKPFDANELLARIRASLRRPGGTPLPSVTIGALSFELTTNDAFIHGKPFIPPKRELLLLGVLMRRAGRATTHSALIEEVYGLDESLQIDTIKMMVSRLRQRLAELEAGVEIHSARGIGYLIRSAHS